jgi:hypothetical protein
LETGGKVDAGDRFSAKMAAIMNEPMPAMRTQVKYSRLILILAAVCLASRHSAAQNMFEVRGADSKYRYVDWNYTFHNSAVVDTFYIGVPGSNEFNLGGGYGIKIGKLTVSPLLYAVLGKEGAQRGLKMALLVTFDKNGWKLNSFLAHYAPLSGEVSQYQVLDTLDFSRVFGKHWEFGISNGFFHSDGKWNPQAGPMVKLNDRFGSWAASYRFGPQKEFRLGRIFVF